MEPSIFAATAQSDELDARVAAEEIIAECERQLGGKSPQAAILFAGIDIEHQVFMDAIIAKWKGVHLVGCTTDGEFSCRNGYTQDSALLVLLGSDDVEISSGFIDLTCDIEEHCRAAVKEQLEAGKLPPRICLMFSDGMTFDSEKAIALIDDVLGNIPVFGGLAADQWKFTGTKQFFGNRILANAASFLLLCGSFNYAFGVETGWKSVGEAGVVNKAEKNVVYEINHKPALAFYHELLGEHAFPSGEMPIAVYDAEDQYRFLRTSFQTYDKETGSITFLGNVPEGYKVRLTIVDRESILSGAVSSMKKALTTFPEGRIPSLALCFSCAARRAILGTRTKDETQVIRQVLGEDIPIAGFYTYGEICPPAEGMESQLHNESFVSLLLG